MPTSIFRNTGKTQEPLTVGVSYSNRKVLPAVYAQNPWEFRGFDRGRPEDPRDFGLVTPNPCQDTGNRGNAPLTAPPANLPKGPPNFGFRVVASSALVFSPKVHDHGSPDARARCVRHVFKPWNRRRMLERRFGRCV